MKRDYPDRPIVGVGAVIVQNGRALVVRRSTEPLMGEWSIPGGVLELGETLRQGAEREALEETGLTVEVGEVLEVFDRIVPDAEGKTRFHYVLIDFLCRPVAGELRPGGDAAEVRWISREELKTFAIAEPAAAVIRKALEAG
ncbi:MAG TPA: NUDIX hydrolase [Terriglobales bacterium]|nr:NUDIX hydrolase [Terriglobales bacterium]